MEELQRQASRHQSGHKHQKGRQQQRGARSRGWEGDELAHRLALQTMDNYARSLRVGISVCVFIILHMTAQSGPVTLVILWD